MRVYVSGMLKEVERARVVMRAIRDAGHLVSYDWALDDAKFDYLKERDHAVGLANDMRDGVKKSDAVVFLHAGTALGALVEVGMALYAGKPVAVVGTPKRESIFYALCDRIATDEDIVEWLTRLPTRTRAIGVEIARPAS